MLAPGARSGSSPGLAATQVTPTAASVAATAHTTTAPLQLMMMLKQAPHCNSPSVASLRPSSAEAPGATDSSAFLLDPARVSFAGPSADF